MVAGIDCRRGAESGMAGQECARPEICRSFGLQWLAGFDPTPSFGRRPGNPESGHSLTVEGPAFTRVKHKANKHFLYPTGKY